MPEWYIKARSVLCLAGVHSPRHKCIRKYDGGRCPLLCKYCLRIIGHW